MNDIDHFSLRRFKRMFPKVVPRPGDLVVDNFESNSDYDMHGMILAVYSHHIYVMWFMSNNSHAIMLIRRKWHKMKEEWAEIEKKTALNTSVHEGIISTC